MTDGELVLQTLAGTNASYEELVRRWSARVLAFCHAKVRSSHAAEDLTQEAMLRGYQSLPTLADPEKFGCWLLGKWSKASRCGSSMAELQIQWLSTTRCRRPRGSTIC